MRNYHVVLVSGTERNITAETVRIENAGALVFASGKETVVAYAAGAWLGVEVERKDDKG